jgi:hypothetical protein
MSESDRFKSWHFVWSLGKALVTSLGVAMMGSPLPFDRSLGALKKGDGNLTSVETCWILGKAWKFSSVPSLRMLDGTQESQFLIFLKLK